MQLISEAYLRAGQVLVWNLSHMSPFQLKFVMKFSRNWVVFNSLKKQTFKDFELIISGGI
jgi:hypothetical protein